MSGLSPVRAWAALPVGVGFRGAGAMLGAWCPGFLVATVWPGRLLLLAPRLQEWGQGRPRSSSGSARELLGFTPANSGAGFAPSGQAFRLWLPRVHFGGVSGDPHLAPKLARGPQSLPEGPAAGACRGLGKREFPRRERGLVCGHEIGSGHFRFPLGAGASHGLIPGGPAASS